MCVLGVCVCVCVGGLGQMWPILNSWEEGEGEEEEKDVMILITFIFLNCIVFIIFL